MTQKHFVIIFLVVTAIAVSGILYSTFSTGNTANVTPTPTTDSLSNPGSNGTQNSNPPVPSSKKQYSAFPGVLPAADLKNKKAVLDTDKGMIEFEIYPEATKTASNFIHLSNDKFYDGLTFHRVEDWVIQGGDPTGTGSGGPGYKFEDEPVTKQYVKGIVAMANSGPNTNGSQFFILTKDTPLPPNYTIFGKVIKGLDVITKIAVGDKMNTVTIAPLK